MPAHRVWKTFLRAVGREEVRRRPLRGTVTDVDPKFLWAATSIQLSLITADGIHRAIDARLPAIFPFRSTKVAVHPPRFVIATLNACPIIGACTNVQVTVVNGHRHNASRIVIADTTAVG